MVQELLFADDGSTSGIVFEVGSLPTVIDILETRTHEHLFEGCSGSLVPAHLSIRSLIPKHDEVHDLLVTSMNEGSMILLGLSETWLDCTIPDSEIAIHGFKHYRRDRNRNGGGVLVYAPESVKSTRRLDLENDSLEAIWIEVKMRQKPFWFCTIYS